MHIEFADKRYKRCYESLKERKKELGTLAKRYYMAIKKLEAIPNSYGLFTQHKYMHPHGHSNGERTFVDLSENYRLLFWIKKDDDGNEIIIIDQVCDPHGNKV